MALQLRTKHRTLTNPSSLIHLFSTSSDSPNPSAAEPEPEPNPQSQSQSHSSGLSDVKASSLKQPSQPQQQQSRPSSSSLFNSRPSKAASLEEIRKNLSKFRLRSLGANPTESNPPAPQQQQQQQPIYFQELYNKGVKSGRIEFQTIRESLRLIRPNASANEQNDRKGADGLSLERFKNSLDMKPGHLGDVAGRTQALPRGLFDKQVKWASGEKSSEGLKTEFVNIYSYGELGEKLRKLRPAPEEEASKGFTLRELGERLVKLRKMEEIENQSRFGGLSFEDLRQSLVNLKLSDEENLKKASSE